MPPSTPPSTAIRGTIILAKLSTVPVHRGALASLDACAQEAAHGGWCHDCYTSARGCTATLGNVAKATFDAIFKTYSNLIPDLCKETIFTKSPYQEFIDHLLNTHTRVSVQRTQAPLVAIT
ncbi:40S ribosomal protein S2 [Plecturocebus cupreus]